MCTLTNEPTAIDGVRLGTAAAGIRYLDRDDVVLVEVAAGSAAAAVFTRNKFCAAPIVVARDHLAIAPPRYLLINAGNANAGTGESGIIGARQSCRAVAALGHCDVTTVLPFSTGVIGAALPVERLTAALPSAFADLHAYGWDRAARAIMTTDTVPKRISAEFGIAGHRFSVTGIAKGAGMICPDMATLLSFVATDAPLSPDEARRCLARAVEDSFHRITVDGDTSTNDSVVLLATGRTDAKAIPSETVYRQAEAAVSAVCSELAQAIVRDAEGATKFITIHVTAGASKHDCLAVARTIAHSPLVKTALFASDPNWGRILAAVGRAPVPGLEVGNVSLRIGDVKVLTKGEPDPDYGEALGKAAMSGRDIDLYVSLGMGTAAARIWTSDLSTEYVRINAAYRS